MNTEHITQLVTCDSHAQKQDSDKLSHSCVSGRKQLKQHCRQACVTFLSGQCTVRMQCLIVLCLSLLASQKRAVEYWMRPNHTVSCPPGVDCITLSDMIVEPSRYNVSNLTIHLLPGIHSPNQSNWIILNALPDAFSRVQYDENYERRNWNWSFIGHPNHCDEFHCDVVVECKSFDLGLAIIGMGNVSFANLLVKQCGLQLNDRLRSLIVFRTEEVWTQFVIPRNITTRAAIVIMEVVVLSMENVHITKNKGYGLLTLMPAIQTSIHNCSFKFNNRKANDFTGGNAYFLFPMQYTSNIELSISHSTFAYGKSLSDKSIACAWQEYNEEYRIFGSRGSGGLTIGFSNCKPFQISISIINSNFTQNYAHNGANLYIIYFQVEYNQEEKYVPSIVMKKCTFRNGYAAMYGGGLQLEVQHLLRVEIAECCAKRGLDIYIKGSQFIGNHATHGGGIAVQHERREASDADDPFIDIFSPELRIKYPTESSVSITIERCVFQNNTASKGAGIYHPAIHTGSKTKQRDPISTINLVNFNITSSSFIKNTAEEAGGGIYVHVSDKIYSETEHHLNHLPRVHVAIDTSKFSSNRAGIGSAISIVSQSISKRIYFFIYNCRFNDNTGLKLNSAVMYFENIRNMDLRDATVINNQATGLYINGSEVEFLGIISLINNTAQQGAAIFLDCTPSHIYFSMLIFFDTIAVRINNNRAMAYGGGIAVKEGCSTYTLCFFQLTSFRPYVEPPASIPERPVLFIMENNTAGIAGDEIYGGNLEYCHFSDGSHLREGQFSTIFQIQNVNSSSAIVSQPYRVCICTQSSTYHNCSHNFNLSTYPGQQFHVPAVGTGQFNNPSQSVIRAEVHAPVGYTAQLGDRQTSQDTHTQCKNLTYSIQTRAKTVTIKLSLERPLFNFPTIESALFSVTVLECPFGFELVDTSSDKPVCDCVTHFTEQGVQCDINNQTIHQEPTMWIGNFSDDIVLHHNCPFGYCKQEEQDLDPNTQSTQCNFNRTGVLCGACQPGLSLALGTSQCLDCSNTYLLLLILFAVAGVVLVVLLLKCNLTVSTGTINGLIFYANIVQANRSIFFPVKGTKFLSYFLSIFIAWLNLDFGFEVCFMNSLDAYTRTWFQFLFPLYIWILVALLILVSRYSITVSRMTGSNTVSVLATLFLLSYAKLLQTTLNVFSFTNLTDRNGTDTSVWLLDGNYGYKQWPHTALFIAALVTLLAHLLPFTFLLSLAPLLQKYSYYTALRWIFKFKPLMDAYQGPYKVKFRWWTGLMLLLRLFLFSVFATNAQGDPRVNLLSTELVVLLLLIAWVKFPRIYRKASVNIVEIFFILNLGVYAAAVQYVKGTTEEEKLLNIVSCCMVGSAFVAFLLILAYHCYTALSNTRPGRKLVDKAKLLVRAHGNKDTEESAEIPVQVQQPTVSYVAMKDLRESLLTES